MTTLDESRTENMMAKFPETIAGLVVLLRVTVNLKPVPGETAEP
jgi:hypothetical protein